MSKITKEVKIGIAFLVAIFLLYFGINFLKGINIFKPANAYIVKFDDVAGMLKSDPVTVNGLKVGQVFDMKLNPNNSKNVLVLVHMDKGIVIPIGSKLSLDAGMLGGSTLILDPASMTNGVYQPGDTLQGTKKSGLMDVAAKVVPQVENLIPKLDSILTGIEKMVNNPALNQSLDNVGVLTGELTESSRQLTKLMTSLNKDIPTISGNLVTTTDNFQLLSKQFNSIDLASTFNKVDSTMSNVQHLSEKLSSKDSSLGLLLNDTQLHDSLTMTLGNASKLLEDVKANPSRYINVKVF